MNENVSLQVEHKQPSAVQQTHVSQQTQVAATGAVAPAALAPAAVAPAALAPAAVAPATGHVSVPLVMLQNLKSILEICGDRGSFKTSEMYGIGLTYNELSKYISDTEVKSV